MLSYDVFFKEVMRATPDPFKPSQVIGSKRPQKAVEIGICAHVACKCPLQQLEPEEDTTRSTEARLTPNRLIALKVV